MEKKYRINSQYWDEQKAIRRAKLWFACEIVFYCTAATLIVYLVQFA